MLSAQNMASNRRLANCTSRQAVHGYGNKITHARYTPFTSCANFIVHGVVPN